MPPECPECGGFGWVSSGPQLGAWGNGAPNGLRRCPCRTEGDRREAQARRAAQLTQDRGGKYATASLETFDAGRPVDETVTWEHARLQGSQWVAATFTAAQQRKSLEAALAAVRAWVADPRATWLYFQGNYGSGKTHLAVAALNALAAADWGTFYDSVPRLLKMLRQGIADHSTDTQVDALIAVDALMLDDLGAEHVTAWAEEKLFDVINERYRYDRPTIITSNRPLAALSGRVASRLTERCQVITLVASDYRLLAAPKGKTR